MEELFNKPILDQMYEFRKETFEQTVFQNDKEIKQIEEKVYTTMESINNMVKKYITDSEELEKFNQLLIDCEMAFCHEIDYWDKIYFKLGMIDRGKIIREMFSDKFDIKESETYLGDDSNDFPEWIERQKRKYDYGTSKYKELSERYNKLITDYPNVCKVFEDLEPIALNDNEMYALVEMRKIDIEFGQMEEKLCFKLGMNEIINL